MANLFNDGLVLMVPERYPTSRRKYPLQRDAEGEGEVRLQFVVRLAAACWRQCDWSK
jgi:hypothetical protein